MIAGQGWLWTVIAGLLAANTVMILWLIGQYWWNRRQQKVARQVEHFLAHQAEQASPAELDCFFRRYRRTMMRYVVAFCQNISVHDHRAQRLFQQLARLGMDRYYIKRLDSAWRSRRMEAAVMLGLFPSSAVREALEQAIRQERDLVVRLYLAVALSEIADRCSLPVLLDTLVGAPAWYREKVQALLHDFGQGIVDYFPQWVLRPEKEVQLALVDVAAAYATEELKRYLLWQSRSPLPAVAHAAVRSMRHHYAQELAAPFYLQHDDPVIRQVAIEALAQLPSRATVEILIEILRDRSMKPTTVYALSTILRKRPRYIAMVVERFQNENNPDIKNGLAATLGNRIEYFLAKLLSSEKAAMKALLYEIISLGKINSIIGFLNKNKNIEIEDELLPIIGRVIAENEEVHKEFCTYLNERILRKLGQAKLAIPRGAREEPKTEGKIRFLYLILALIVIFFPSFHVLRHGEMVGNASWMEHLFTYVIDYNYFLIYYTFTINTIYLLLLIFSVLGVMQQNRRWQIKRFPTLFRDRMLPSVSIIAPAYNEEATVVESVNSLLNLNYPDYELIVVNDGSTDQTLNTLIRYFSLEKVDRITEQRLQTMPVRGIYMNESLPKLLVIDKINGGKADSLNTGINYGTREFFCGIDADSLLETDALLRIASLTMDEAKETIAAGGNIFPINGCTVERGMITATHIPKGEIARMQTIEYLRAFIVGRVGWAFMQSLLIVSGAFGLFNRERVIEIGGYMTAKERFRKDTVGEDMEIVVRLNRHMREKKLPHATLFAYNANCWTEVPDSLRILGRQRDRWQRGLIEIMAHHKRLIFNPVYGRIGLIAFPYFLFFEMIGPIVEFQGYIMVLLAFLFGLLDLSTAALLFLATVCYGILISIASLLAAERQVSHFSTGELITLIGYSLLENLGYRQLMSYYRVAGFFSSLRRTGSWGKMERKGFVSSLTGSPAIAKPAIAKPDILKPAAPKPDILLESAVTNPDTLKPAAPPSAGPSRLERWRPVLAVLLIIGLLLSPIYLWWKEPIRATEAWIVDYTVPNPERREHLGLVWVMNHYKFFHPNGRAYMPEQDYYGFFPKTDGTFFTRLLPEDDRIPDMLYLADAYGVYSDDFLLTNRAGTRSELFFGGLREEDEKIVRAKMEQGTTVIAEFNTLALPTAGGVRSRMEQHLGIHRQGWIGRFFLDLSRDVEVPVWLVQNYEAQYNLPWDFHGPGFAFVSDTDQVLVLRKGIDTGKHDLTFQFSAEPGQEFGITESIPYYYWFEWIEPADQAEVLAEYHLDVTEEGLVALQRMGLKPDFPAIIRYQSGYNQNYYFAGDFADSSQVPRWWQYQGFAQVRKFFSVDKKGEGDAFFWRCYVPMMHKILNDQWANKRTHLPGY
ncbi:glycosyltransferase [Heliophilum fasciatum]|uniref:Cellulose synthase/poly-beta-1,6-N-acetylglucosamine synthase-like glycosyltransferase n=1 Tax=Heliophilum fasciatum TaxID=35700 RepID=A0A4R2RM55_9FIRM|nr:glycosyltransferase [Heliophilum fasciatum]MCW2278164.1 cellulose synthase/poly-beta-1,6-N-acetylglucosamine synthase-like glycosyltransferase/HEAT repeat protein [Heliophilum fasciatum]TCP64233.1 cellulose synthase/poly-beta-1,6-N-acetylglucosamine synthase-like glycosyltransferase [Heliophilum fasciatum]